MEGATVKAEDVRDASAHLPERQREALELHDRDQRSYEEIAAALGMNVGAVGQLIARARINLYDELRGTPLASVVPSPDCERALPLIAMREDGRLEPSSESSAWLESHLLDCERCALAVEQMREAEVAYRAWAPGVAPAPARDAAGQQPRRRRAVLSAALAGLLLLGGVAAVLANNDRSVAPSESAASTTDEQRAGGGESAIRPVGAGKQKSEVGGAAQKRAAKRSSAAGATVAGQSATESADGLATTPIGASTADSPKRDGGGGGSGDSGPVVSRPPGKAAVEPTRQTSASRPSGDAKSPPVSTSTPQSPPAETVPVPEPAPAAEVPADEPGHRGEPPGKPADRPSH